MIRTFRAEFVKLLRRRVLLLTGAITLLAAVGGSAVVLAAAEPAADGGFGRAVTVEELSRAGGGTDVFRIIASFTGTFLFVVFVGIIAVEFSRGTMRTMLLRQPRRVRMLAGKLAALLTFAAVTLAIGEIVTWIAARAFAPSNDIATNAWTSTEALGAALTDYGAVLLWVTGYAVFGTMVAVLLRSVPVALGVGIAWAGPIEHIVQDSWSPANRLFPGLLLEAFVGGGNADVSSGRALLTVSVYAIVAAALAAAVFARRDVTA
jgi:NADH:ubiquinone oxidoreductase subunit 6 (subunit J)